MSLDRQVEVRIGALDGATDAFDEPRFEAVAASEGVFQGPADSPQLQRDHAIVRARQEIPSAETRKPRMSAHAGICRAGGQASRQRETQEILFGKLRQEEESGVFRRRMGELGPARARMI